MSPRKTKKQDELIVDSVADAVLEKMDCPLLSIEKWKCDGLQKGEEPTCKGGKFMNCPAYRRYFNFRLARQAKERSSKKEDK